LKPQDPEQRQANTDAGGTPCPFVDPENGDTCSWILHPSWVPELNKGFLIYKEHGTVWRHRHSTKQFHEANATRQPKPSKVPIGGDLADALVVALGGNATDTEKAQANELVVRQLANIAQRGTGSAQVSAIETIGSRLLSAWEQRAKPPQPGERCSVCGRLETPQEFVIDKATAVLLHERGALLLIPEPEGNGRA
jgi:hypothetical protein